MAVVRSGATSDEWTIDPTSNAGRVTLYDNAGATVGVERVTYRAATAASVVAAASTVSFFAIGGSATKTIRVRNVRASGMTIATLTVNAIEVKKWSTAITGGTATALTQVPLDSLDAVGTASLVNVYTVAPTDGTLVGRISCVRGIYKSPSVVDGSEFSDILWSFGTTAYTRPVVLRGVAQYLSLAFGAAPSTAVTLSVEVEWTEE